MEYFLVLVFWFASGAVADMSSEKIDEPYDSITDCKMVGEKYKTPADFKGIVVRYYCVPSGQYFSQSEFEEDMKE